MTASTPARPEITEVWGLPENEISAALLAALPRHDAPAPWDCACSAVVWLDRSPHGRDALAPSLRGRRPLAVAGGLVQYESTPVGSYGEALAMVAGLDGVRPWASVPFMAVDSPASLVGGRTNWALPKSLAAFDGVPGIDRRVVARGADDTPHGGWTITATARPLGPALPVRAGVRLVQDFPGHGPRPCTMRSAGRIRPAVVTVEVRSSGPLPSLLRSGRRLGAIVEQARFTLGEPELG